ncbi:methyl-accepting chemotaxis protein [Enterovibrio baiacu]|uniref:methyl-accepting chemotaxis protein n=1 Tax=Enterovibrio baiacu TaxID=2491023 RepID=UPI001012AE1E|nr:methyl-accepting chemotaxis protein [Enterovibrio baiacu]MBE1275751.1 methyl-accepting chemotaxis protein [Enterovibrio baiacu]
MLSNLRLGQQLTISFSAVLALLLVVSVVGYSGLSEGYKNFTDYRGLARSSNEASEAQSTLLSARLGVLKFLKNQDAAQVDKVQADMARIDELINTILSHEKAPDRIRELEESKKLLQTYSQTFALVVKDFQDRNALVSSQLDPNGLKMRQIMSEVIKDAELIGAVEPLFYASQIQEKLLLGRLFAAKFLISNSEADLKRSLSELNNLLVPFSSLKRLSTSQANVERSNAFSNAHRSYISALEGTAVIITKRNDRISNTLDVIGPQVTTNLSDFKASIRSSQDTLGPEAQSDSEAAVQFVMIASALAIIVGIILSIMVTKAVRRPIGGEPRNIENMARNIAQGDLTQDFSNKKNATGIYAAMGDMSTNLRDIVTQLKTSLDTLNGASNTLVDVTKDTANNSEAQADQLGQTSQAMHELTATVDNISQNAQQASNLANQADSHAHQGQTVLDQTRASIDSLVTNMGDVSETIESLENETKNVGSILDVIRGIAEQTNLLALNAAIEAARAGEQGRGFAVVADEVRSLASRTQQSTEEIQELILRLQSESKRSVDSMRVSMKEATDTSEKANKTREALVSITESVASIRDMNNQIAVAAEEQNAVVLNINQSVDELNTLAKNTASGADTLSKEASGLTSITRSVNDIVGKFSLG